MTTTLISTFLDAYKSGHKVKIAFTKKNGELREMVCQRDPAMESVVVGGRVLPNHIKPVVEIKDDGTKQWRSVTLNAITKVELF